MKNKYWKLTILNEVPDSKYKTVNCVCDCWNKKQIIFNNIRSWKTISCWCSYWTHKLSGTPLYIAWNNLKNRCDNPSHPAYNNYWGRGISYDKRWKKFDEFYEDMKHTYKKWLTLERINNELWYSKENCCWVTQKMQLRNRRNTLKYKWKPVIDWCEELNLDYNRVKWRILICWWDIERAIFFKTRS